MTCSSVSKVRHGLLLSLAVHGMLFLMMASTGLSDPVNVALRKPVKGYYTCGSFGREAYSILSEAFISVRNRPRRDCKDLRVMKEGDVKPVATHPASEMVDGIETTWWQSVSRNKVYYYGTELAGEMSRELEAQIDLDLLQEFLVEEISINLGDALSPQKIAIYKSQNGQTYTPWMYAVSNLDFCSQFFSTEIRTTPTINSDTICVGYVADDRPPGDKISLDVSGISLSLKEWQRVRYLRVKFYDMMFISIYSQAGTTFNHYAVRELTVMAECPCNGMQTGCEPNPTTGMYECICGGNTRGRFCESCQAMFNQYKFEFGKACESCNCFNHATSCIYQASVETNKESLDINGNRLGGGVCLDCQNNTAGVNCEKCVSLSYRPQGRQQTDPDACVPCECDALGSTVNPDTGLVDCLMNDDEPSVGGKLPGDCYCKENVQGSKCNVCKQGFYNLDGENDEGCTACNCFTPGTVVGSTLCTPDVNGQCDCKSFVEGRACDKCKDGYYGLEQDNVNGCVPCDCNVGGAVDQVCDKLTGQCRCRSDNILGRACDTIRSGFYHPSTHAVAEELEDSLGQVSWKRDPLYSGFSGRGYAVVSSGQTLTILLEIPEGTKFSNQCFLIITYRTLSGDTTPRSVNIESTSGGVVVPMEVPLPHCSSVWCEATTVNIGRFNFSEGPNLISFTLTSGQVFLDKVVAFPEEYITYETVLQSPLPAGCNFLTNTMPSDPQLVAACEEALLTITMFYWMAPLSCDCDVTGSISVECEKNGGQCPCQPGVVERMCSKCSPDHYAFSSTGCTACSCDGLSSLCDAVSGQCQCPENTVGLQCEACLPNHWDWDQKEGCKPCDCNAFGSLSLQCNATTGVCSCREGAEGVKCELCQDAFYGLNSVGCIPCGCSVAGAVTPVCNKTDGVCECKANAQGAKCDSCLAGTFDLAENNVNGCLECICMGITTECTSAGILLSPESYPLVRPSDDVNQTPTPSLTITLQDGSPFNMDIQQEQTPNQTISLDIDVNAGQPSLYWKVPTELLTNLVDVYQSFMEFGITYVIVDGQPFSGLKAFLRTSYGTVLSHSISTFNQEEETSVVITFEERSWLVDGTGASVSRKEFLKALAAPESLLVPASFASGKHTARISRLVYNTVSETGNLSPGVEQCVCGAEYAGNSCQMCAPGYRRENVSTSEYFGVCVPCECNGHSNECNPDTGVCLNCLDNTTGDACEQCALGFYGDATQGTSTDCSPCPCYEPRVENPSCRTENQTDGSTAIVCDFCRDGYIGPLCNECDASYFGNPEVIGGTCSQCECNGNADVCDKVTGVCQACSNNTEGDRCERCIVDFYGNASLQTCQACECLPSTSTSTTCADVDGQCPCVAGVGGRTCDQCLLGYWGYNVTDFLGCQLCGCVEAGSLDVQCDASTGQCNCKPNTGGLQCDQCVDDFYGLPLAPCEACACDAVGTVPGTFCNKTNGQCECQPGIGGRTCDKCLLFYVDFAATGCTECGQCPKAIGNNIDRLAASAESTQATALAVLGIQEEDERLHLLTSQLESSLNSLGLAGSGVTSVNDLVQNITTVQQSVSTSVAQTETKVDSLLVSVGSLKVRSEAQATRHVAMEQDSVNLAGNLTDFEQQMTFFLQYMGVYNMSASQYLNQAAGSSAITLSLDEELRSTSQLLADVRDNSEWEQVNGQIESQANAVTSLRGEVSSVTTESENEAARLADAMSNLNVATFTGSVIDDALTEGLLYKSQAEDLISAVNEILLSAENRNSEAFSDLTSAQSSARNTETIYTGVAMTVMTGEDFLPFPNGITNYGTGKDKLDELLTALPILIDRVEIAINKSEAHSAGLEEDLAALKRAHQSISPHGTEAVQAIDNFKMVVTDLDGSIAMATEANQLIEDVKKDISGPEMDRLQTEYTAERSNSDALLSEIMALDYQPQVLGNLLDAANKRLDGEETSWETVDSLLSSVTTAGQTLNAQYKDTALLSRMTSAEGLLTAALSAAESVIETSDAQNDTLNQKTAELDLMESQITRVEELQTSVQQKLSAHQVKHDELQSNLVRAGGLRESTSTTRQAISNKIQLLEDKLANAESLLSQLRQPLRLDESSGVQVANPIASTAHAYDNIVLDVRKPANVTDAVIFFTEDSATNVELEVGLAGNNFFFEFNAGQELVRVDNPAAVCADCWLRIYASRYATTGHLTIQQLSSGGIVSKSSVGRDASNAKTMVLTSNLFVGTIPDSLQTIKVENRNFSGCVSAFSYQSQQFSLWTTALAAGQSVTCCQAPPTLPTFPTIPGASFSGFSYLVLQPPGSLSFNELSSVSFEYRSYQTETSLLLVRSEDGKSSYSISITGGRIEWKVQMDGIIYTVPSQNTYATAVWIRVLTEIDPTSLKMTVTYVDGDQSYRDFTSTEKSFVDLSALDGRNLILGSSEDPSVEGYQASSSNFAGCLRDLVMTTSTGSIPISFNEAVELSGVTTDGCFENVVPGIRFESASSYAILAAADDDIAALRSVEIQFITKEMQGILLYISTVDNVRFLYVAIFGGNIMLVHRQETVASVVSENLFVSDGQFHTLSVDFSTLRVTMRIDGIVFEEPAQTLNSNFLTFPLTATLYVGGVTGGVTLLPELPARKSLIGGSNALYLNGRRYFQDSIVSYKDISLAGIPAPPGSTPAPPVVTETPPIVCVAPAVPQLMPLDEAILIDGSKDIVWDRLVTGDLLQSYFAESFRLNVEFITFKADGVLLYVANALSSPTQYIVLYLSNGYIHLRLKSSLGEERQAQLLDRYNDAQYHELSVIKINDYVALESGKDYVNNKENPDTLSQINIPPSNGVNVAGMSGYNTALSALPDDLKTQVDKTYFAGAIKSLVLRLDPKQQRLNFSDLDRKVFHQAPLNVYYGVSLSGVNSYLGLGLVNVDNFIKVGLRLTTSSASGLLIMLYKPASGQFIVLDVLDQQVRLHLYPSYNGVTEPLTLPLVSSLGICDNQPHYLILELHTREATLTVDGVIRGRANIPLSHAIVPVDSYQFFIGGSSSQSAAIPADAVKSSLQGCILSVDVTSGGGLKVYDPTQYTSFSNGISFGCPY